MAARALWQKSEIPPSSQNTTSVLYVLKLYHITENYHTQRYSHNQFGVKWWNLLCTAHSVKLFNACNNIWLSFLQLSFSDNRAAIGRDGYNTGRVSPQCQITVSDIIMCNITTNNLKYFIFKIAHIKVHTRNLAQLTTPEFSITEVLHSYHVSDVLAASPSHYHKTWQSVYNNGQIFLLALEVRKLICISHHKKDAIKVIYFFAVNIKEIT